MIIKSNKFAEVSGALAKMNLGIYSIQEIIDTINQVTNIPKSTEDSFINDGTYCESEHPAVIKDLWVDLSYQRPIKLQYIHHKLKKIHGFKKKAAGSIDVYVRPNGKQFVWDGFRRTVMAGLCGHKTIKQTISHHPHNVLASECVVEEADTFIIRNTPEKISPETLFKAEVAYQDPNALKLLSVIQNADLDVAGLNPTGKVLGGFAELQRNFHHKSNPLTEDAIIRSSRIIQTTYDSPNVGVYLLCGLAHLLQINEDVDMSYSDLEIIEKFHHFIENVSAKQTKLTNARVSGKQRESVAFLIAKKVIKDNNGLLENIGLNDDTVSAIEEVYT